MAVTNVSIIAVSRLLSLKMTTLAAGWLVRPDVVLFVVRVA
jgi:hypothetical protein